MRLSYVCLFVKNRLLPINDDLCFKSGLMNRFIGVVGILMILSLEPLYAPYSYKELDRVVQDVFAIALARD